MQIFLCVEGGSPIDENRKIYRGKEDSKVLEGGRKKGNDVDAILVDIVIVVLYKWFRLW